MGMLVKTPKYTPPRQVAETSKALATRESSADAATKKEMKKLAARRAAMKRDPRSLLGTTGLLGVQDNQPVTEQMFVRSPADKGPRYT
jgi:hypothetical protein|tara:strand:+ start:699 stop:962 length:264 start_codon:yes stop_codon:yes gene_type:complete